MNRWVEAARPRTLPASVAPVIAGTAAADRFVAWRFGAALTVALALQVAVNFANDLSDARRGVDTPDRVGPRRTVASGLVAPGEMRWAIIATLGVALAAGVALALAVEPWLLVVGAAAIAAALLYSGGPRPYASAALGEVAVFVFFGLVATGGSAYVQGGGLPATAVAAGVALGALAAAILLVNNLRDIPTDARAAKRTLAVRLGAGRTVVLYRALLLLGAVAVVATALLDGSAWPLLGLAAAPLALEPLRLVRAHADPPVLVRALVLTARLELATALLLGAGLWISS